MYLTFYGLKEKPFNAAPDPKFLYLTPGHREALAQLLCDLFTDRAIARIRDYAGGIPRVINILCDHSLLFAYADQERIIDRDIVEQAIVYLQGKQTRRGARETVRRRGVGRLRRTLWAVPVAVLAVVIAAAVGWDTFGAVSEPVTTYLLDLARAIGDLVA